MAAAVIASADRQPSITLHIVHELAARNGAVETSRLPVPPGSRQFPRRRQHLLGMAGHLHLARSEEHTSELQSLMRISYAVFCLKKKKKKNTTKDNKSSA